MTDLPDEIVDRVAKAIYEIHPLNSEMRTWDSLPDNSTHRYASILRARAALQASGWVEMREALQELIRVDANLVPGSTEHDDALGDIVNKARAALAAARGEKP